MVSLSKSRYHGQSKQILLTEVMDPIYLTNTRDINKNRITT